MIAEASTVAVIAENLRTLHPAGEVFEVRLFSKFWSVAGFFNDADLAASEIARYDGRAVGIYHVANVADPALLERSPNRLRAAVTGGSTANTDIIRRSWLPIDIDPDRPDSGTTNATDEEKAAAGRVFWRIKAYLEDELGWPAGFVVDSGNGLQGGWPIDEPHDPETTAMMKRILRKLAEKFDEPGAAHVDLSVSSAAQLLKLPGTMVRKGPHSEERPHRRSILAAPHDDSARVTRSALEALAGPPEVKAPTTPTSGGNGHNGNGSGPFDLEAFIDEHIDVTHHKLTEEGEVWEFNCPFNAEHRRNGFLSKRADGALLAGCNHDTCTWRWDDLREKYQPEHKVFMAQQAEALAKQAEKDAARAARQSSQAAAQPEQEPTALSCDLEAEAEPEPAARDLEQEAAHAEVLRSKWLGRYRFAAHLNRWRRWDGTVWATVTDSVVADAACKVLVREYDRRFGATKDDEKKKRLGHLHKSACTFRGVAGALAFLRGQDGVHTDVEEWDADPYTLNCADGLLDLRTCELRDHDPAAMCTRITVWGLGKDGRASSGAWEHHLTMCLPSADVRRQVQRDLGRALVDAVLEHSLSIWYGIGRNGKSTTSEALLKGLAGYGMEASKDLLVQTKHERHPTEIAELAGARVVFVEETTDGKHLDEAQVKRLTGGGNKRAHFMRQDNFNVPQTFSISLLVNHRPHVTGGDPGIWERLRLVPWTTRIPRSEQRPQEEVVEDLHADGAFMLRWLVAGFRDWQNDHHWIAEEVQAATREYRAEEDALQGFIDRYCDEGPRLSVPMGELYDVWVADFIRMNPTKVKPSKIAFGKLLRDRGITAVTEGHSRVRLYRGITLKKRPEREQLEWDETPAN